MPKDDTGELPSAAPPPLPGGRRASWWAWPLVVFALIPYDFAFDWLERVAGEKGGTAPAAAHSDAADLALLKLQAQVVIASASFDPDAAEKARDDLAAAASGDRAVAALALLECFVEPASPRAESALRRLSPRVPEDLAVAVREAVRTGAGEEAREKLRAHLGWFAELARGPELAPPPQDGAIRSRAVVVVASMGLAIAAVCLGLLAGVVLLISHLRRIQSGESANAFVPTAWHGGTLLECCALYLGIMTAGALAGAFFGGAFSIAGYFAAVAAPLLWPRWRGLGWSEFRRLVGLHRGRGWWREIGAGCVGYLGVLAVASIGIALTLGLTLLAGLLEGGGEAAAAATAQGGEAGAGGGGSRPVVPETHPLVGWIYEGGFWTRLACLALAAGFAPLFEELFFRGAVQRYFRGRFRFLASALLTALIFAALHPQGVFAIPALAGIGVGFSLLREWRDSLIAPMTAHAINNGCLVAMLWWAL